MTSGKNSVEIRKAVPGDLDAIKQLADEHRPELGFVMRPALQRSIEREELYVAEHGNELVGFVEYHHRKDNQTTLYHIAVKPEIRHRGIGRQLVEALRDESVDKGKAFVVLKCPSSLPANKFYDRLGWQRATLEKAKARPLFIWRLTLENADRRTVAE